MRQIQHPNGKGQHTMSSRKRKGRKKSVWTEELVEELLRLWQENLSAADIARRLGHGLTRNAVIGKIHRLRAEGRAPAKRETPQATNAANQTQSAEKATTDKAGAPATAGALALQRQPHNQPQPAPAVERKGAPTLAEENTGLVQDIQDLNDKTCRWPIGDPGADDFCFCGRKPVNGLPYCEHHAAIAYQNPDQRRRATG